MFPPNSNPSRDLVFFFMVALISVDANVLGEKLQETPRIFLALSAVLVGGNWLLFIWAVNNHHMLEASLGYINPLVNILLGMIFSANAFVVCSGWR